MIKSKLCIKRTAGANDKGRTASIEITFEGKDVITLDAVADKEKTDLAGIINGLDTALVNLILTGHVFRTSSKLKKIWMALKWNG